MKTLICILTLLIFTSNQVMAYAPDDTEMKQIEIEIKNISGDKNFSFNGLKKDIQKKIILGKLKKELRIASIMNVEEQTTYAHKKLNSGIRNIKKISTRLVNSKTFLNKMSAKTGKDHNELKTSVMNSFTNEAIQEHSLKLDQEIAEAGSYANLISQKIQKLESKEKTKIDWEDVGDLLLTILLGTVVTAVFAAIVYAGVVIFLYAAAAGTILSLAGLAFGAFLALGGTGLYIWMWFQLRYVKSECQQKIVIV